MGRTDINGSASVAFLRHGSGLLGVLLSELSNKLICTQCCLVVVMRRTVTDRCYDPKNPPPKRGLFSER